MKRKSSTRSLRSTTGAMAQLGNLRATMGAMTGTIDTHWNPVPGAKTSILQCRAHGATEAAYAQVKILTRTKFTVTGLTQGVEYGFCARRVWP